MPKPFGIGAVILRVWINRVPESYNNTTELKTPRFTVGSFSPPRFVFARHSRPARHQINEIILQFLP